MKLICLAILMVLLTVPLSNLKAQRFFKHASAAKSSHPQPEARIPVAALGYMPPGMLPAFEYHALVGLYFIDANRLLFTFNAKGLLRRDDKCFTSSSQRILRAVVLDIPSGKVEKQADWELYDFADYLWNLGNGKFLLRRCSELYLVDSSLALHPIIEPSGSIAAVGFSPDRSVIVVEQASQQAAPPPDSAHPFEHPPAHKVDVEFIRMQPLAVIARAQIPVPAAMPIVNEGILEALISPHKRWTIDMQSFHGAARKIVTMRSTCMPRLTALTDAVVVAGICSGPDHARFQAFDMSGTLLWQIHPDWDRHLPRFLLTRNGAHFAIESLHANRPLAPLDPLSSKVIDANVIDVYDTQTGTRIGSLLTTPVYTAGKNADFSPDGTRMAVLRNGAIEIYTLDEIAKNRR